MPAKSRAITGANQSLSYEFRIRISSYKSEAVKLQVWDRLRHAAGEVVNVTLLKAAPALSADAKYQRDQKPSNLLRWDVNVEPKMNGEKAVPIKYEFKMELGDQMTISSFQTQGAIGSTA